MRELPLFLKWKGRTNAVRTPGPLLILCHWRTAVRTLEPQALACGWLNLWRKAARMREPRFGCWLCWLGSGFRLRLLGPCNSDISPSLRIMLLCYFWFVVGNWQLGLTLAWRSVVAWFFPVRDPLVCGFVGGRRVCAVRKGWMRRLVERIRLRSVDKRWIIRHAEAFGWLLLFALVIRGSLPLIMMLVVCRKSWEVVAGQGHKTRKRMSTPCWRSLPKFWNSLDPKLGPAGVRKTGCLELWHGLLTELKKNSRRLAWSVGWVCVGGQSLSFETPRS